MFNRLTNLIFILLIILNCNSKISDKTNNDQENLEKKNHLKNTETISIDKENSIIKWIGKKLTSSHEGTIRILSGELIMENDNILSGEIDVDMTTILNTDIENKNARSKLIFHLMNEDFFHVDEFPISSLMIKKSEKLEGSKYKIFGDLTIKGITNSIDFNANIEQLDNNFSANMILIFDRTLWDIKYGSGKFFENLGDRMILDDIELEIKLKTL